VFLKDRLSAALHIGPKEKGGLHPKTGTEFGTGGDNHDLLSQARIARAVQTHAAFQMAELEKQAEAVLSRNSDLVNKFLEIAERKISILDEYGDEDWDSLPDEIRKCLTKIAEREPSFDISKVDPKSKFLPRPLELMGGIANPVRALRRKILTRGSARITRPGRTRQTQNWISMHSRASILKPTWRNC
jgi:hypothetical protein